MTSAVVLDASVVVTALLQADDLGARVAQHLLADRVVAPALLPFEVANAIRRQERSGLVDGTVAEEALQILADLRFESWGFGPIAPRIWELRSNVTSYDAAYVALAELTELPLITLDRRLARAPGIRCEVVVPS